MLSKEKAMDGVHLFVLDLDGTVYLGDQPIKGSIEFVRELEVAKDRDLIAAARLIARLAHRGQVDKAGDEYFAHPEAVAAMLDEPEAKVVGYLHDTVEDTEVTIPEIREIFGDRIADAVALMTHAKGVPYMDYVKEIGKNPLARKVKMADLTHNMDIRRIKNPRQKDYDRIERKYKPAYAYLKGLE